MTVTVTTGNGSATVSAGGSSIPGITVGKPGPAGPPGPPGPQGPQGITPKFWSGTRAEFDALPEEDPETLYLIYAA